MNHTTKTFSRTMSFRDADYANCTEGSQRHPADKWINRVLALAVIVVILSVAFSGAPA